MVNQRKQRYLCKKCGKIFVENPHNLKKIAIRLYTDGIEKDSISKNF